MWQAFVEKLFINCQIETSVQTRYLCLKGQGPTPTPQGFPYTMLSVKKVKDNMWQAFIEKLFINCENETSLQTRYVCLKGQGPTPLPPPQGFPYTMLSVKKVKDNVTSFHWKTLYQSWDWDQRANKILVLQRYVVQEWKLFVWHQLCLVAKSINSVSMWQHVAWGYVRCVERYAICRKALSRLQLREGWEWIALVPCLSKYTES